MKKLLPLLLLIGTMYSCQKSKDSTSTSPAFEAKRSAFFNSLRAPQEVAARLQATAAEFNADLLHNPENAGSYTTSEEKAAANLGIYLADLSYCVAYGQSATTKELFAAAHQLSKVVGVEESILDFLSQRYEENLHLNDSAKAVIDALLERSTSTLKDSEREKLIGITMSAYQIENLYLSLGVIKSYPKDMLPDDVRTQILIPVFKHVLAQRTNIEIIYEFVESISDVTNPDQNPNYPYYANALQELIGVYRKLNIEEKIANNQGIELMNDEVALELSEKVSAIRNKITSIE
ncbi:MAG: hypothetical protein KF687_18100 [Cyclobacteriaceae bacterium]|nr:hypothetical protein [Cyclobacteriaceae bacterium]